MKSRQKLKKTSAWRAIIGIGLLFFGWVGHVGGDQDLIFSDSSGISLRYDFSSSNQGAIFTSWKETGKQSPLYSWEGRLKDLIFQVLNPFPREKSLEVIIGDFRDAGSGEKTNVGKTLELELHLLMGRVEGVHLSKKGESVKKFNKTKIPAPSSKVILLGLYRSEGKGLRINATLQEISTKRILSTGHVVIREDTLELKDLAPRKTPGILKENFDKKDEYHFLVNKLLSLKQRVPKVSVKVWTDRKAYEIGDKVTFSFRSDQDAYITLIDVGTSGDLRMLFPNRFHPESFVQANQTYRVPSEDSGFSIRVDGPPGLERIKAFATEEPLSFFGEKKMAKNFYSLPEDDLQRTRDLKVISEELKDEAWGEDYIEIYILGDGLNPNSGGIPRGIKPKPPKKPIDIIGVPGAQPEEEKVVEENSSVLPSKALDGE